MQALKQEVEEGRGSSSRRIEAARRRAAEERKERVEAALKQMAEVKTKKKPEQRDNARVSTTDPEARVMKMADGGFRPAFNAQFAADTASQVIVGVDLSNSGSDQGKVTPMLEQIKDRYDRTPQEYLVDGGFARHGEIDKATGAGVRVYAPGGLKGSPAGPIRAPASSTRKKSATGEEPSRKKQRIKLTVNVLDL